MRLVPDKAQVPMEQCLPWPMGSRMGCSAQRLACVWQCAGPAELGAPAGSSACNSGFQNLSRIWFCAFIQVSKSQLLEQLGVASPLPAAVRPSALQEGPPPWAAITSQSSLAPGGPGVVSPVHSMADNPCDGGGRFLGQGPVAAAAPRGLVELHSCGAAPSPGHLAQKGLGPAAVQPFVFTVAH